MNRNLGTIFFVNEEDRFAVAGHQLLKYLGTFNWKIWLARRTLEQITINSIKGAK